MFPVGLSKVPSSYVHFRPKYNVYSTLGTAVAQCVDGIQYKNGAIEFIQTEEGRILPNGSSFAYEYFLTDHLSNARAVVDHRCW